MFLLVSVILFTGVELASQHASQVTWPASRGSLLTGGSASREGVCLKGICMGGGLGRPLPTPSELEKWPVRILLEWFLVLMCKRVWLHRPIFPVVSESRRLSQPWPWLSKCLEVFLRPKSADSRRDVERFHVLHVLWIFKVFPLSPSHV